MAYIDLSSAQLDTPHPAGGNFVDLNSMQLDAPNNSGGLVSKISNDLHQRSVDSENLDAQLKSRAISTPEYALQKMGNLGKGVGNVVGDTVGAWWNENPDSENVNKMVGASVAPYINSPLAKAVSGEYENLNQQYPRTMSNVKAAGNTLNLAMPAAGEESATGSVIGDALKAQTPPNITQMQARVLSGNMYQKADDIGAVASPDFTNNKILGAIKSQDPQTAAGSIGKQDAPFTAWAADAKSKLANQPQSLTALQELDENLSDHIEKYTDKTTGFPTSDATPFIQVQKAIRTATKPENLSPSDLISGTPDALQAWKSGQGVWSDSYKLGDIERINNRAALMPNPSQAIQTGYRQIATSRDFQTTWTPAQQALIKQGATKGLPVRAAELIGSGLTPMVGGAIGGVHGAGVGFAVGAPFRAMAKAMQAVPGARLGENISGGILDRFPDYVPTTPSPAQYQAPLALPPPSEMVADQFGNVRKNTPSDISANALARQKALELSMSPDVTGNISRMGARATTSEAFKQAEMQNALKTIDPNTPMGQAMLRALKLKGGQ